MAILAECPICRKIQSDSNAACSCGEDLTKAKVSRRVRYFVHYRDSNGRQRKELVGSSRSKARTRESDCLDEKDDIAPDPRLTFDKLANWYLDLERVKALSYYKILKIHLDHFNSEIPGKFDGFGKTLIKDIRPYHIENYQALQKGEGLSDCYIDHHVGAARAMVNKAHDNGLVGYHVVKAFKKVNRLLKKNANARNKTISRDEFDRLTAALPEHLKAVVAMGYYTGMRKGEILPLTWDKVDLTKRIISLEPEDTKDKEARQIPICNELCAILSSLPNRIHESDADNHVFQFHGKPISDIRDGLKKGCSDAGIPYGRKVKDGFVFHDLRHTFNTNMRKAGVPQSIIMAVTGHSSLEMFLRYDTVDSSDTRQAIDQMEKHLIGAVVTK